MNRQGIVRQGGGIVRSETVIAIDRPDTAGCLDHGWQAPSLGTAADVSQLANVARKVRRYRADWKINQECASLLSCPHNPIGIGFSS